MNAHDDDDDDDETFILLLLADSNLPTGSFVASAGLESYTTHGFLSLADPTTTTTTTTTANTQAQGTLAFVRDGLHSYAHSALPFSSDAHLAVAQLASDTRATERETDQALQALVALDDLYEAMTLNHVARRASTAQGTAVLTLYAKAFAPPLSSPTAAASLVDKLKLAVRRRDAHGHLPVCWGVLTAALGLSLARAQHLVLFLHARSLLSAAVRMNNIGPYLAQQTLLRDIRPLVDGLATQCGALRANTSDAMSIDSGPASSWPLGEIIAIRHDLQHSRIFNS